MNMITKDYVEAHPELWQDILVPHVVHGWMWDFAKTAEHLGYKFFLWNDVVYLSTTGRMATLGEVQPLTFTTPSYHRIKIVTSTKAGIGMVLKDTFLKNCHN
jgi:hypothetical protein